MIWIGATLGLRWSEVAGLRVGRLDLVGGKLSVVETIVRGIGGRNVFGPPKSRAGKRTMFMPGAIVTMLSAHLEQAGLSPAERDALVFTDEAGGPLRYSNWRRRVWLPAAKEAECEGAGFHDLRRLNATTLVVAPFPRHRLRRSQAPQNPEALTRDFGSGCPDLNRGPLRPERSALTKLRHSPSAPRRKQASHLTLPRPRGLRHQGGRESHQAMWPRPGPPGVCPSRRPGGPSHPRGPPRPRSECDRKGRKGTRRA